ncbi:MAG: putative DNA binding domain-containing protein [Acinetobacter johnsonii]|nr:putative DNA binding domain-containing protein [Acinetobacter johnsonii]
MSENFKLIDINNAIDQCLSKGVVGNEPILNLIDNGKFIPKEGWLWDYKETINLEAEGIAKTVLQVASFFNSYGGYIIYGVKEVVKDLIFEPQSVDFSNFNLAQLRDNIKKYTGNIIDITFKEVQVCLAEKNYNMGVLYIPKRETRSKPIPFIKNGPMKNNKPLFNINDTYLRILDECRKANTPDDWQLLFSERNFFSINNIESSKLADKRYFEHNLPSKSLICNDFVGREDLLTELWEWLNDEFEFVKILSGDGGKGKTSIAYKFCRTFLENPPIEYERILWLSVKEKQFSGINNSYYEIQDADFSDSLSFLICLADHSAANSNMRCDSFKSLMIINKLSKFL